MKLGEIRLFPGAAFLFGLIQFDRDLEVAHFGDLFNQVDQLDRDAAGQVHGLAVDGAFGRQPEAEGEIVGVEQVAHLPAGAPDDDGP